MPSSMIRIEALTKSYGTTQAVKGVSFEVQKGQVVGFLGPNGAGKSTTMRILAGSVNPTSGKAFVGDIDVTANPVAARKLIGYLPENNPLYDEMMVVEYLRFIADVPKDLRAARIKSAVERCGLTQVVSKDISQLSRGFRQRVGLAAAILHEPDLLILDEPTAGLDPNQIVEIRNLIKELGREKTVILSTHILSEVQSTCSRVLIINEGRLVADDTPERLTTSSNEGGNTLHVVVGHRLGQPMDAQAIRTSLSAMAGVSAVEVAGDEGAGTLGFTVRYGSDDVRRVLFDTVVKMDLVLLELRRTQVSLEDTFRKLTDTRRAA
jgi:ABC-2 type transport system ATP-binding protein